MVGNAKSRRPSDCLSDCRHGAAIDDVIDSCISGGTRDARPGDEERHSLVWPDVRWDSTQRVHQEFSSAVSGPCFRGEFDQRPARGFDPTGHGKQVRTPFADLLRIAPFFGFTKAAWRRGPKVASKVARSGIERGLTIAPEPWATSSATVPIHAVAGNKLFQRCHFRRQARAKPPPKAEDPPRRAR